LTRFEATLGELTLEVPFPEHPVHGAAHRLPAKVAINMELAVPGIGVVVVVIRRAIFR
jgi:hypothetical protein